MQSDDNKQLIFLGSFVFICYLLCYLFTMFDEFHDRSLFSLQKYIYLCKQKQFIAFLVPKYYLNLEMDKSMCLISEFKGKATK